jgi:RNA polymerase sporulation-specific sigma factor
VQEYANCDTLQLIRLAQDGDSGALNLITQQNIKLVYSIAHKFTGRGTELDDLVQLGTIGLIKAVKKFNADFDVKFSTYAVPMIMGEIKRFLRDDGPVKVSRSLKQLAAKAYAIQNDLSKSSASEPTISEIANILCVSEAELAAALEAAQMPESLYTPIGEDDSLLLIDKIKCPADSETETVNKIALGQLIKKLPEREQKIIILRYFKDKTQSQTATRLGISQVQVSRLERKILSTLRKSLFSG